MSGFKATRCHEADIQNIKQRELPRLRAMVGLQSRAPTSHLPFLVTRFSLRDLDDDRLLLLSKYHQILSFILLFRLYSSETYIIVFVIFSVLSL